ncbi:MAG TPA: hypothetical protein VKI99_12270 [Candidatus Dormibacteraeota bacterium]|nr:hypothetical protein [Candidatus Dormibacteraeota bacterium]
MAHKPLHESDLRSLNRKNMYSIFAPLDANVRLARELLDERPTPRGLSMLPRNDQLGRKELAAALWLAPVLLLLTAAALGWLDTQETFAVAGLVAIGLITLALSGPRRRWR